MTTCNSGVPVRGCLIGQRRSTCFRGVLKPSPAHAERWLTPGTEYAVPEKLQLHRGWYTGDIETQAIAPGANNLMSTASLPASYELDESSESPSPKPVPQRFPASRNHLR